MVATVRERVVSVAFASMEHEETSCRDTLATVHTRKKQCR